MPQMRPDLAKLEGLLRRHALGHAEAHEELPPGERVVRVKGKTFLIIRAEDDKVRISVKLPQSRESALRWPFVEPAHYGLGKLGWVTASFGAGAKAPVELLRSWIDESYRALAPKKYVEPLDTAAPAAPLAKAVLRPKDTKTLKRR